MRTLIFTALLLSAMGASSAIAAGSASATMQVGFAVLEACTVQAPDGARSSTPTVACGHAAPYQVSPQGKDGAAGGVDSVSSSSAGASSAAIAPAQARPDRLAWQIYF